MTTALIRGLDRGMDRLRAQAAAGEIDTWWEAELCLWQRIPLPHLYDVAERLIARSFVDTPYFDGDGPWHSEHRGRALYAIENTHNAVAIAQKLELIHGARRKELLGWLDSQLGADGAVDTEREFERLEGLRRPDAVAARRNKVGEAWRLAVPSREVAEPRGPYSALEDAWYVVDTFERLRATDRAARIAGWVQTRQCADGAFRAPIGLWPSGAPYGTSLADTACAVRVLAAAGQRPRDVEACTRWLLARAETVSPTDVVAWLDLIESLVTLGARARIAPEDILAIAEIPIERDPDASRASFETFAAARIVHLLRG